MAPDDFWGQIRRTVNGRPVPEEQIRMILDAAGTGLDLRPGDALLDLACGNGALSSRFFSSCSHFLGVDSSEYLISVAKKHFERAPGYRFTLQDVADYVRLEPHPERFTKALCYGSFSYFSADSAEAFLRLLAGRFARIDRLFIGNLPDRERLSSFYVSSRASEEELIDPRSQIGIWRTRDEFRALARACGWSAEFSVMPETFYAAHYRYDALLTRPT